MQKILVIVPFVMSQDNLLLRRQQLAGLSFGPGKVSMLTALMLGNRFSILTMASRWKPLYKKALDELGLHHKCASVRAIEVPPDNQAHAYLAQRLPVPVINPGPLSYKMAEAALALGYRHSRVGYSRPMHPRLDLLEAMVAGAQNLPGTN